MGWRVNGGRGPPPCRATRHLRPHRRRALVVLVPTLYETDCTLCEGSHLPFSNRLLVPKVPVDSEECGHDRQLDTRPYSVRKAWADLMAMPQVQIAAPAHRLYHHGRCDPRDPRRCRARGGQSGGGVEAGRLGPLVGAHK